MKVIQIATTTVGDPRYYSSNELKLCRSLAKLGHEVTLFIPNVSPKWQVHGSRPIQRGVEVIDGFTIRRVPAGPEFAAVPLTPTLFGEIIKIDCDILHAHEVHAPGSFQSALASRMKKTPLVLTQHDYSFGGTHGAKAVAHMIYDSTLGRVTLLTATAVLGLSSAAVSFAQRVEANPAKTLIMPNSVDTSVFRPRQRMLLRDRWGVEGPIVLFVGRLHRYKRPDVALRAFHDVLPDIPDAKLVMVGQGPEEANLRGLQRRLNINQEQVLFIPQIAREEMPYIYQGTQVIVVPSQHEVFGNVVLEGMASGLPVIGSKIGGMRDTIIHGKVGYHIKPGDSKQLSEYMRMLLQDKELQSKMSRFARRVAVAKFDDMLVARAVEKVYTKCLNQ